MRDSEREPLSARPKLLEIIAQDYPQAGEVRLSFPDQWQWVQTLDDERQRTYVARFPPARERPRFDHFAGLSAEVNLSLGEYRLYKFFRPLPSPRLLMVWNHHSPQGRALGVNDLQVQLQPLGQAQAWVGAQAAVLWECYLQAQGREGRWRERLAALWGAVEDNLRGRTLYTPSYEPTIEQGYTEFLTQQGYSTLPDSARWWRKAVPAPVLADCMRPATPKIF